MTVVASTVRVRAFEVGDAAASTVTVRTFEVGDAAFAGALSAQVFARPMSPDQFVEEATRADRDYLVAELDGRVVGFAGAWDAPDETHVMTIAVASDARRRGVATGLMTTLMERSRDRGADTWTLEVRADEPGAQRLYEGLGFVEVGRRPEYYVERGSELDDDVPHRVDAVLMTLTTA